MPVRAILLFALLNAAQNAPQPPACTIDGTVAAGATPLPGVVISVSDASGGAPSVTSSGANGSYSLKLPGPGRFVITGELLAFAPVTRELVVDEANCHQRIDMTMTLASRVRAEEPRATGGEERPPQSAATPTGGRGQAAAPSRGFQALTLRPDANAAGRQDDASANENDGASALLLPPGFSPDISTASVTAVGSAQPAQSLFDGPERRFPNEPGGDGRGDGPPFGGRGGGPGNGGPGFLFGGGGGPGQGFVGRGGGPAFGRGANNRIRGAIFQSFDTSALDAAPFALNGQATGKPDYLQQRFGATMGGPIAGSRTLFFVNYTGNHARNPYDAYSTVPTLAERGGDLSALQRTIVDPATNQPFSRNQIPASRLDPTAQALLGLVPLPNQAGDRQNFHTIETTTNQVDDVNVRFVHLFGAAPAPQQRRLGRPGGASNVNFAIHFHRSEIANQNPFPTLGGETRVTAWDVPVGFSFTKGGMLHAIRFQFNRQRSDTQNLYASTENIAGEAGLLGVATDPFDWGAPNLSFSSFTSLRDLNPAMRVDRTIAIGDTVVKTRGRHTVRFGGDYRDVRFDSRADANARGSFVFTGLYTGVDFADFLLGLPQQATVQFGPGLEQFRSHTWDAFLQDDWRVNNTLTINAGLRYEYYSPYGEAAGRLVNLDVASDFASVVPVVAGGAGSFAGALPDTLVRPDHRGFAPRVGIAWKPQPASVVRAGYGINYSASVYQRIAQQLATQPPFAVTNTVLASAASPVPLASALTDVTPDVAQNTYAVDPDYRLGSVQIWNVDVQHDVARTVNIGVGYTCTKGANLDIVRAPNRGPDGLLVAGVQPFLFESSEGASTMHALAVRIRKRLTHGFAAGATYTLSKSRDDASAIGGVGDVVVAQNDRDLEAEWGLSSFDQRHRFAGDFTLELPFGANRRWLNSGAAAAFFGDWRLNGSVQIASGTPFTARLLGAFGDVAGGVNGTLRANYDGEPIAIADPTAARFFNTAAFSVPDPGTFGNAGRNTIIGPGTSNLNLGLTKDVELGQTRVLSIQILATNVLNDVQFAAIDTVVNSPTFGRVTSVRAMRRVQIVTRFRF